MTGIRRTPSFGKVLAAVALLGPVGCQQVPSQSSLLSARGWGRERNAGGEGTITPAQQADVQIAMGRVAEKNGDLEQAMAAYRAALSRDSRRADAYLRMAVLHDKQGGFRESAEFYRKALALRPGDPEIFCDMGYSLYLQRRWAESESNLRQAIAVDPGHRRAHNNLALLLVCDNRIEDALAEFQRAGSSPSQAHMNLAFALTMDRRWEPARAEYERALALDPSSQLAKDRLGQLSTLLAKVNAPREVAPRDSRPPAASAAAAPPRRDARTASVAIAAINPPPGSSPTTPVRDPNLIQTAANVGAPPRHAGIRLAPPPLPVEDDRAMRELWASVEPPGVVPPSRSTAPPTRSRTVPAVDPPEPSSSRSGILK